uniref:Uncharacterized protein n=1 Tax=Arundo donax TaxID=35708 RepID=A0A0A9B4V9_ARUDO
MLPLQPTHHPTL